MLARPLGVILYVLCMADRVRAWRPEVPHVREVLHATFEQHAYPAHTHHDWTLLLVDEGVVSYELGGGDHLATPGSVTLLPPDVAHDGRSAVVGRPFRKRVVYLEPSWLPPSCVGRSVDRPTVEDARVVSRLRRLHTALSEPSDGVAEAELVEVNLLLRQHLGDRTDEDRAAPSHDRPLARRLRDLLDADLRRNVSLQEAGRALGAHPAHLARSFARAYGMPPHRYVTGRRVDRARRLLLTGTSVAEVAVSVGFFDQAHLTRHFRQVLGSTPARFARGG